VEVRAAQQKAPEEQEAGGAQLEAPEELERLSSEEAEDEGDPSLVTYRLVKFKFSFDVFYIK
jgi:hypothetical protein